MSAITVICEGCPYYERHKSVRNLDAPTSPDNPAWYTHRCWRDPAPVVRLNDTREPIVRACAHKPGRRSDGRKQGAGYQP